MKTETMTLLGSLYRRAAEGLGFAEADSSKAVANGISDEARRKAREATKAIRAVTERHGLFTTRDEVLELVKSGRR